MSDQHSRKCNIPTGSPVGMLRFYGIFRINPNPAGISSLPETAAVRTTLSVLVAGTGYTMPASVMLGTKPSEVTGS